MYTNYVIRKHYFYIIYIVIFFIFLFYFFFKNINTLIYINILINKHKEFF